MLYAPTEQPLLLNFSLPEIVDLHLARHPLNGDTIYILFDEVQYQRDWDIQLKAPVNLKPGLRFIVTGSAGAALSVGSRESGAGRFSNFYLPALLFHEYLELSGNATYLTAEKTEGYITELNRLFIEYI